MAERSAYDSWLPAGCAGLLALFAGAGPATATKQLTSITSLQPNNILARSYRHDSMEAVNAKCKGIVSIKYLGGQEVLPPDKSAAALKSGPFDLLASPATYFVGAVPEDYAAFASNESPRALRENGAYKMLQDIS